MKKGISVMFFICLCLVVAVVFPRLSSSYLMVDSSGCRECHDFSLSVGSLHNAEHHNCVACHGATTGLGTVAPSACLACHPAEDPGPGTDADKCELIEYHEDDPMIAPLEPSCFSSTECHLNQCDEIPTTTTTTAQVTSTSTTTITNGPCPAESIYGEGSLEVTLLRAVRDTVLSQTPEGREIIKLYYQWSPVVTMALRNDEAFKAEVKELLDGILSLTLE